MDKDILRDYIDACELVRETESDIKKLQKKRNAIVQTSVKGSNPEWPYQEQHFHVEGMAYTYTDDVQLRREEQTLWERKKRAEGLKLDVEAWLNTIPHRMQRIIRYKIFEDLTWHDVAKKMGRGATEDGIRKEYDRFFEKNESLSVLSDMSGKDVLI